MDNIVSNSYYYNQVNCIDRQIAELEARKAAILGGYCFVGYYDTKTYIDPYELDGKFIEEKEKLSK